MNWHSFIEVSPAMILFWVFAGAFLVQLLFYFGFFGRLAFYKRKGPQLDAEQLPSVSVVICARNEDDNLVEFLPLVLTQDYPDFEVVVVDDCSFDNTGDILKELSKKHNRLRVVTIKEDEYYQHGKKVALMMGIKGAMYEHLLLTDADCRPASDQWLRNMASQFTTGTEIVVGYGPYFRTRGLLNKIIRFDTFVIALQYLSFSLARVTYMGVGRNLAYTKDLFYRHKGFKSHYHIPSGDDDLFVNEAATRSNTRVELASESFTHSKPKQTFSEWWMQKKRHIDTGKRYRFGHKFLLGLLLFSQWLFFGAFVALLVLQFQLYIVLGVFLCRFLMQMFIFSKAMRKLGETDLLPYTPVIELFLMFFYPVIAVAKLFQRRSRWT